MKTRVVNRHLEPYTLYIGRGTIWGNPYIIGKDGTREEVIEKYREYAENNEEIMANLHKLKGQVLGCSCKPLHCHGDVLLDLIEKYL